MIYTQGETELSRIIRRRRRKLENRTGYMRLLIRIAAVAAVGYLLFTQAFLIRQAPDNDMFPAVKDGDLLIGFRLQKEFLQNDVIVYEAEGETHVGRIIGQENDVITMDENGTLMVNGTVQSGEILFPTHSNEDGENPCRVPEGHVYVLGDYRTQAKDSRIFGTIPIEDVKAKVITILRRRVL